MTSQTENKPADVSRPTVSEVTTGPEGRSFSITFREGQRLPTHHNESGIRIVATAGAGILSVEGLEDRVFAVGDSVHLEARIPHALLAGSEGLSVTVHLVAACCQHC